jgi:large subunit ribosomal protein L4
VSNATSQAIDFETASPAEIRRFLRPAPQRRTVTRRSSDGADLGEVALEASIFGIEPNLAVLHQVVTAQLAAARSGTQSTKTRAEVRGGGAKPFRQKGTGRARQGSTRSPQWVGGGVALGPKPRSYAQKTPKKMIQLALRSALSDRASQGRVALIDAWTFEVPSTKGGLAALDALGLSGRILVVLGDEDGYADRSFGNLPEIQTIMAGELNAYDILVNDWIVFTDATLPGGPGPEAETEAVATDGAAAVEQAADAAPAAEAVPAGEAERAAQTAPAAQTGQTDEEGSGS